MQSFNFYIETLLAYQGAFISCLLRVNIDCVGELLICLLNLSQITTFLRTRGNSVYINRFFISWQWFFTNWKSKIP